MGVLFFFSRIRRPPRCTLTDTLCPSPALFRSAEVGDGGDGRGAATSGAAHSMWVVLQAPPPRRMVSDTIRRVLASGRSADWRGGGLRREHLRRADRKSVV